MSRLIVNADDLGYTAGVDRAVLELHSRGALSSATAMARGEATRAGVSTWVRAGLAVGCHIVLVDGAPVSPPQTIPSLLVQGHFRATLGSFLADLHRGRIREREIEREALAQMQALAACGLRLTHVDTHKHTHMFERVLRPVLRAAARCGIAAIRNPFEPAWARAATPNAPLARRLQVALLSLGQRGFLRAVTRQGLRTTAGALGVLATGTLTGSVLDSLLAALARHGHASETWELVTHPGFADADLARQRTRLQSQRVREFEALGAVIPRWCAAPDSPHTLTDFANL